MLKFFQKNCQKYYNTTVKNILHQGEKKIDLPLKACINYFMNRIKNALIFFRQAFKQNFEKKNVKPEMYLGLGISFLSLKDLKTAYLIFSKIIELWPKGKINIQARLGLVIIFINNLSP